MVLISHAPVRGAEFRGQGWELRSGEGKGWREAQPKDWTDLTYKHPGLPQNGLGEG